MGMSVYSVYTGPCQLRAGHLSRYMLLSSLPNSSLGPFQAKQTLLQVSVRISQHRLMISRDRAHVQQETKAATEQEEGQGADMGRRSARVW